MHAGKQNYAVTRANEKVPVVGRLSLAGPASDPDIQTLAGEANTFRVTGTIQARTRAQGCGFLGNEFLSGLFPCQQKIIGLLRDIEQRKRFLGYHVVLGQSENQFGRDVQANISFNIRVKIIGDGQAVGSSMFFAVPNQFGLVGPENQQAGLYVLIPPAARRFHIWVTQFWPFACHAVLFFAFFVIFVWHGTQSVTRFSTVEFDLSSSM